MYTLSIEMLAPEQVDGLWPALEPMLAAACDAHEIAKDEMDAGVIHQLARSGMCALFVMYMDAEPTCVLAIQFHETNGRKGADAIAFAGKHMLRFKQAYWDIILEWLKANGVEFLDAYIPEDRVAIYQKKLGFTKSCAHVRMTLH